MHRVFQAFIDGLAASSDADSLRTVLAEAGGALDLSCFAYLALPSRRGDAPELISTYPVEWTDHYLRQSYERLDPVVVGALVDLVPAQVEGSLAVSAFGAFLVAQQAVRRMLPRGHGAVLLTGASASVKGFAQSAPFAMGKFALRGLAQSMARELAPQGIHVAHFVIDGAIRNPGRAVPPDKPESMLDPDAIAENYLHVLRQPRSTWTWEMELRPWVERF
jgi:NAD(P)-dependent dehydrogenase (short-subunit alcohol dehydrogenase family)